MKNLAFLILFFVSQNLFADWAFVSGDESGTVKCYFDKSLIKLNNGVASGWVLFDYKNPQVMSDSKATIKSSKYKMEMNCKTEQTRSVAFTGFAGNMGTGMVTSTANYPSAEWIPVTPGTVYESLLELSCGITSPETSKASPTNQGSASSSPSQNEKKVSPNGVIGSGTAWQISKTHLVTAYHVVQGAASIAVMIGDEDVRGAYVATYDETNDLAILKIDGAPLRTASINLADAPAKLGSNIAVLGFPLPDLLGTKLQANTGEISAIHGLHDDPRFYRITANVQGGNSGGPVINQYGEAIGVVSSKLSDLETLKSKGELPQNVNFAVKNLYLRALMESAHLKINKSQRKLKPIDEVIQDMKDSVFLVITETKK